MSELPENVARNRAVSILRIGLPILGVIVVIAFAAQGAKAYDGPINLIGSAAEIAQALCVNVQQVDN